ncbi:hypothetical protein DL237_10215 [Pseudooceanicola sediminis]|uniref:MaoC-like domain-containing protein n=1 Tax=Pseudooceanicola sediminis TaxID=2211117 RepID=A0A399J013_9RHOB|nr:MaoC/PaaZ C-terminal domain-containing protein [Pseudooceanicola sediminis]KAA2313812.1 hypothetical protein E0K93_11905 [Puniceibacterium sp. HSS470]RII38631.1 hypothetical protein DL237_10215 [Pseudooceanicola sediminis]|tara:strand:- start:3831 stop:4316 length:486 start_codon:yes stop_codon:yes gene_type:complete
MRHQTALNPREGDVLPPFEKTLTPVDLMAYGAATWDWYACHYNDAAARDLGLSAPFVDGQMWGAWFARQLRAYCGPQAFVGGMKLRYHAMCFAGDHVECRAVITSVSPLADGTEIEVSQQIEKAGTRVASCISVVILPATGVAETDSEHSAGKATEEGIRT